MNLFLKLPKLLRFLLIFIPSLTLFYIVLRVAFYIAFSDPASPLIMSDFIKSMWLGLRFDLRMVVLMVLPLFFLGGIKWISPFKQNFFRYIWLVYLSAVFCFFTFSFMFFDFWTLLLLKHKTRFYCFKIFRKS